MEAKQVNEIEFAMEERQRHRERLVQYEKQREELSRLISNTKWSIDLCDLDIKLLSEGKKPKRFEHDEDEDFRH